LEKKPTFDSLGYSGTYDALNKSITLAPDRQSVVVEYTKYFPDWELYAPGVSPVHTLVALQMVKRSLVHTHTTWR
jgi:hypothetical protein